jgi:serine/threonine-protein kinase
VVAIKIPHADQLLDKNFVATFQREAEIGLDLRHPSIVKVLETGNYRRGRFPKVPYFVMEYLEGQDLNSVLRDQGPIEPTRAAQIARSVADALQWAHHRGVVHRDVTPRNIFITTKQLVKVMDFGISTVRSRTGRKAQQGVALNFGTPHYMAPERVGQTKPDERSDLYALGCVFFEMLTGRPPFHSKNQSEILKMHKKEPVPDFHAPAEIKKIVLKLLEKDPKKRYQKAAEVTADLADLVPIV